MAWTINQQLAIDAEGADVLVAAGAGSGKTAVLVERIAREVLDRAEPYNVDDLLVLTFTKAAAEEMRSRLYKRMDDRLEKATDEAIVKRIYEQQVRLRRANIGTIDSFCKKLLAENVKESGIDDSWSVCDSARGNRLLAEAVDDACEQFSQTEPDSYKRLLDVYGKIYSDKGVAEAVRTVVYSALNAVYPIEWINEREAEFTSFGDAGNADFAATPWGRWLLGHLRLKLKALLGEFKQLLIKATELGTNKYIKLLETDIATLTPSVNVVSGSDVTWKAAFEACSGLTFYQAKGDIVKGIKEPDFTDLEKAIRKTISKKRNSVIEEVLTIKDDFFFDDPDSPLNDRRQTGADVCALSELARNAYEGFQRLKAEQRLYDYGDMERNCLKVLTDAEDREKPSELALSYRHKFREVYVDEYQDTNELQERILDAICGTPGNRGSEAPYRFMVGDVKQSIYGFRGGCPDLFMDKYRNYTVVETPADVDAANAAGSPGVKILLGENFRSRREIIDSVNGVFDSIMNENTAGMPYGEPEHLVYGAKEKYDATSGDPQKPLESPYCTEVIAIEKLKGVDDIEAEAHEIAGRIKKMVLEGEFGIADGSGNTRPVRYGDITILIRDIKKVADKFAEQLRARGVPVKDTEARYGLFRYPEIRVLTAFMHVLDNPLNDIPLLAVLKNIYGFSGDMLTRIARSVPASARAYDDDDEERMPDVKDNTVYLYDKLCCFAQAGQNAAAPDVRREAQLAAAFLERLEALRVLSGRRPVAETVWECMNENGFAEAVDRRNDGGTGYGNLMRLLKLASGFDDTGRGGFCDFVSILEAYEADDKNGIGAASPEGSVSDAVTLCTIHKSKGLDYQVVFVARAHKKSDQKEDKNKLLMHKELGFGPTCLDKTHYKRYPSAMKTTIKLRAKTDNHMEELRVLYVAMTRAHEKMFVTGIVNNYQSFIDDCDFSLDPDRGNLPSDYNVIKTDSYLKHLGMAALGKRGDSIALRRGAYTAELVRNDQDDDVDDKMEIRFCLPPMPCWDPVNVAAAGPETVKAPPAKISVSEVKRLSNAALAAAEEDAGTTLPTLRRPGDRGYFELKPLDGGQTSARDAKQAALAGTLLHCCLEHVDFAKAAAAGAEGSEAAGRCAEELITELTDRGFFSAEDAKLISRPILTAFICSEFVKEVARADYLRRELPFTFSCDAGTLLDEPAYAGQSTAVQGVIDCVYRADGQLILADYKSDRVQNGDYHGHSRRYLPQLSIYAEACRRRFGALPDKIVLYYLRDGKVCEISSAELKRL